MMTAVAISAAITTTATMEGSQPRKDGDGMRVEMAAPLTLQS